MDIFPDNVPKPVIKTKLPRLDERIESTMQLIYCTSLIIRNSLSPAAVPGDNVAGNAALFLQESTLDKAELDWLEEIKKDPMEQESISLLPSRMVSAFSVDILKDTTEIVEIVALGPVLQRESFRMLLNSLITDFGQAVILDVDLLQGLVDLVQSASSGYLVSDDLIVILSMLRARLQNTHQQSSAHPYYLTLAVSRLLDVMADHKVQDMDRVLEHEPLSGVLSGLQGSSDPYLMYQACYAFQALQYVSNDETVLQAVLKHSTGVVDGLVKATAVMKLDLGAVLEELGKLQKGLASTVEVAGTVYEGAFTVVESGRGTLDSLKEGLGSGKKRPWYAAVRAANALAQAGQLKDLKQLIFEAPCRHDPLFQWGVCQLLGEIAVSPVWAVVTRQQAINLLGYLFKFDRDWGHDESAKAWMLAIVTNLGVNSDHAINIVAHALLQDLKKDHCNSIQHPYPLTTHLPIPTYSPILDRVYNTSYIDNDLNVFRRDRLKEADLPVYIAPMAKANLQARDDDLFPLMKTVQEFLESDRQVMLILGDSGSGKTTFNNHLEQVLLRSYKIGGCIPLFINLPTIARPEEELITKQLKTHDFTDAQIQELKQHHRLVAICDGYDESQLTINLHTYNHLNHPGQWNAKLIIACRTQYLGPEYRDRFVPKSLEINDRYADDLFQEAAIIPFSVDQIQNFINLYVRHNSPPWTAQDYLNKLKAIPNLMDMAKNPFLLTITLETLPSVVAGDSDLSKVRIFRAQLYDVFVEKWLLSNQQRLMFSALSVKDRDVMDRLVKVGFVIQSIGYSTRLASEIFGQQNGNPVVQYIDSTDHDTWRANFFGPQPEVRLLRESSPLARTGNHFRFIHRSILEYFFSRAIFDPDGFGAADDTLSVANSPLSRRSLTSEPSVIQFLCDRVQQSPTFTQQLRTIIEQSKTDPEASQVAANSITILSRAGVRFNGTDLSGVRIPGADLSGAELDSVRFHGADLTGVKFSRSWIRQVDFTEALMSGVQFGERSVSCSFSSDGQVLSMGMSDGAVKLWDASTFHLSKAPRSQSALVSDIVFSPNYQQIASASEDFIIQMWDAEAGQRLQDLAGHTERITSMATKLSLAVWIKPFDFGI
ncbi:hypothetical protein BGZ96_011328 [Linnemannia gamsii]|uniref:NACHT domain-containing protein n=1 Tax=Linnemannia gamsii TaxID=64522 RepID=A0ABQ7KC15_9FUNG|nr:hypothetical protein BGZ96_011328 [Linnemannia gamsii]